MGRLASYKETTYLLNGREIPSRFPLYPIQEEEKPEKIIILSTDTIFKPSDHSYKDHIQRSRSILRNSMKSFGVRTDEIILIPGTGKFRFHGEDITFMGCVSDIYNEAIYRLTKIFSEIMSYDNLEIVFDASLGWNLVTLTIDRVLKEIGSQIASIGNVRYRVMLSEPYLEGAKLKINQFFDENLRFNKYILKDPGKFKSTMRPFLKDDTEIIELKKEVENKISNIPSIKELSAFTGAIKNLSTLAIYTFFPDVKELWYIVETWHETFSRAIEISENCLIRRLCYKENFANLVKITFMASLLNKLGIERKIEVSLEELERLGNLLKKHDPLLEYIFDNEISHIRKTVKESSLNEFISLGELISRVSQKEPSEEKSLRITDSKDVNTRVFLAHAGFPYNATEVEPKSMKVRYRGEMIEKIRATLSQIAEKG